MVDIVDLPGEPKKEDFRFKVGNDDHPDDWGKGPKKASELFVVA